MNSMKDSLGYLTNDQNTGLKVLKADKKPGKLRRCRIASWNFNSIRLAFLTKIIFKDSFICLIEPDYHLKCRKKSRLWAYFHHPLKNLSWLCLLSFCDINSYIIGLSVVLWLLGWRGRRWLQSFLPSIPVKIIQKYRC